MEDQEPADEALVYIAENATDMHRARARAVMLNGTAQATETMAGLLATLDQEAAPIPMRLVCEACGELHIDEGEFETKPHHTHACQSCGAVWRPALVNTVGVRFLPGFKNLPMVIDAPGQLRVRLVDGGSACIKAEEAKP